VRFATNAARVRHREALLPLLATLTEGRTKAEWLAICEAHTIPAGPVNDLAQVFASDQVAAREMRVRLPHPLAREHHVDLIGNPLKLSQTPVQYRKAPPRLGEDTQSVLANILGLTPEDLRSLADAKVIQGYRET
jgi:crotonobetainyl-CoA:carnitine CoA-transferase CaiB-like acyl-CoA transferase